MKVNLGVLNKLEDECNDSYYQFVGENLIHVDYLASSD